MDATISGVRFELRNFPFPVEVQLQCPPFTREYEMVVTAQVHDTVKGTPTTVVHKRMMLSEEVKDIVAIEYHVYSLLRQMVVHELDEAFHVDGIRVRDPHGKQV